MIDPLLQGATPHERPTTLPDSFHRRRRLRIAGAAGVGTFMVFTGYVTGAASSSSPGWTSTGATDVASAVTTEATAETATTSTAATSATSAPGTASTIVPCTTWYTVSAGDSWIGIAHRAGIVVDVLYLLNGAAADTVIHPGDEVCLPDGAVVATTTTTVPVPTAAPATTTAPVSTAAAPAAPSRAADSTSGGS